MIAKTTFICALILAILSVITFIIADSTKINSEKIRDIAIVLTEISLSIAFISGLFIIL